MAEDRHSGNTNFVHRIRISSYSVLCSFVLPPPFGMDSYVFIANASSFTQCSEWIFTDQQVCRVYNKACLLAHQRRSKFLHPKTSLKTLPKCLPIVLIHQTYFYALFLFYLGHHRSFHPFNGNCAITFPIFFLFCLLLKRYL